MGKNSKKSGQGHVNAPFAAGKLPRGVYAKQTPRILREHTHLFLSAFAMFVPSLSWQNDRF